MADESAKCFKIDTDGKPQTMTAEEAAKVPAIPTDLCDLKVHARKAQKADGEIEVFDFICTPSEECNKKEKNKTAKAKQDAINKDIDQLQKTIADKEKQITADNKIIDDDKKKDQHAAAKANKTQLQGENAEAK